jgi:CDP-glycerol glycerophosphotransferase (TagB/SpsB family)
MFLQMRAGVAFVTHSLSADMNPGCISSSTIVVNTWHGITLKKIMYGASDARSAMRKFKTFIKKHVDRVDYVLASSPLIKEVMSDSFHLPTDRVWSTGYPRTDLVLQSGSSGTPATSKRRRILFAPSFRDHERTHDYFQAYGCDIGELASALDNAGVVLEVRLHPMAAMPDEVAERLRSYPVFDVDPTGGAIWDVLPSCDCVITDMSSIAIEFMALGRPVFFLDLGMTLEAQRGRPLILRFSDIPKELRLANWRDISRALPIIMRPAEATPYWASYVEMRDLFLKYGTDGDACQSVVAMVRRACLDP